MTYQDIGVESPLELRPPFTVERPEGSGTFMRLYDDVRKCVVYLGIPKAGSERELTDPMGTGFLIGHDGGTYIVTAAHVAKELEDAPFGVRLNDKKGNARVDRVDEVKWWRHTDDTVDVAVMNYAFPDWADTSHWITKWMVSDFKRNTKNIGAGDLAYIVGMYYHLPGTNKNLPIVHTGHIAMMADGESIPARDWRNPSKPKSMHIEGHLIEAQTLDGLSGSPVFVRISLEALVELPDIDRNKLRVWWHGSLWLLGLWHGAWYGEPADEKRIKRQGPIKVPAGMGVVIPAPRIIEVLDRKELVSKRNEAKARDELARAPEPQSTGKKVSRDDILRVMLNTLPQPNPKPKAKAAKHGRGGVNSK